MLLAEANQWPEDVLHYFGEGDECHMAFHFPLMPRIYMAVAPEDRHPITDIMRQTPEIPENCQWAIFLRNHDELTLEMVTDRERDYLWNFYAADRAHADQSRHPPPARAADGERPPQDRAAELRCCSRCRARRSSITATRSAWATTSFSATATACARRCNGRPTATAASPAPIRPGSICRRSWIRSTAIEAVNVEAQSRSPTSLLNWMKRLIAVRRAHRAFGRGTLQLPLSRAIARSSPICASSRTRPILCVANLSRSPQAVELDLSEFKGRIPVELIGRSAFPPIGDLPYLLTLPGYGFFWFVLRAGRREQGDGDADDAPRVHHPGAAARLAGPARPPQPAAARERGAAELPAAPALVRRQGRSGSGATSSTRGELARLVEDGGRPASDPWLFASSRRSSPGRAAQRYLLPLGVVWEVDRRDELRQRSMPHTLAECAPLPPQGRARRRGVRRRISRWRSIDAMRARRDDRCRARARSSSRRPAPSAA